MIVIESKPSDKHSIDKAARWIKDVGAASEDASRLWKSWTPDIMQSVKYEFSDSNPNAWKGLSPRYEWWKTKQGFPSTIGVQTGALRAAASEKADITYDRTWMRWTINGRNTGGLWGTSDKKVEDYVGDFNAIRPIFGTTLKYIRRVARETFRKIIKGVKK